MFDIYLAYPSLPEDAEVGLSLQKWSTSEIYADLNFKPGFYKRSPFVPTLKQVKFDE